MLFLSTVEKYLFVSILVAARNEEDNIQTCIESLINQSYPKEKIEILVGDDGSEDDTYEIVQSIAQTNNIVQLFKIKENLGLAKGKANVLAQLAKKAKGEVFLITDADMVLSSNWVKEMVNEYSNGYHIITGFTTVEGNSTLAKWQKVEWVNVLTSLFLLSKINIPISCMGNNMLVSKSAYESTGGYEKIPFSVVEDFALFQEVIKKGWKFKHLITSNALGISKPEVSFNELLKQRFRWGAGLNKIPWYLRILPYIQTCFLWLIIPLIFFFPVAAICALGLKIILQSTVIIYGFSKAKLKIPWLNLFTFEFYQGFLYATLIVKNIFSKKVEWKGRLYKEN